MGAAPIDAERENAARRAFNLQTAVGRTRAGRDAVRW
jgi:hypothetical protein